MGAVEVEAIPETPENEEYLASLGLTSSVKDDNLPNGIRYKILIYKKTGNIFVYDGERDVVVGDRKNNNIKLITNQNYTLIILSNKTNNPPYIFNREIIDKANILNDNLNEKILYQRIDNFIPNGVNDVINVKLKYKTNSIRIILDASDILGGNTGEKISFIEKSRISFTKRKQFNIGRTNTTGESLNITKNIEGFNKKPRKNIVYSYFNDALNIENETNAMLYMEYKLENRSDIFYPSSHKANVPLKNLRSGYRYTFRVKLERCGAYLGANKTNWRQFMCENLGAIYPNKHNENSNYYSTFGAGGDKYQWGTYYPEIRQFDHINYTPERYNYNDFKKYKRSNTIWTWDKGLDNPCPNGYRVPTKNEWEDIIKYNTLEKDIYSCPWDNEYGIKSVGNCVADFGNHLHLSIMGGLFERSSYGRQFLPHMYINSYWSSSISSENKKEAFALFISYDYRTNKHTVSMQSRNILDSMSVKCIKKLPNE